MPSRSETDYTKGLYGDPLPTGIGLKYLKIAESACRDWGGMRCLTCRLADWTPESVPFCGAELCDEGCRERDHCACGNPMLRDRLRREMRTRLREGLREKCAL